MHVPARALVSRTVLFGRGAALSGGRTSVANPRLAAPRPEPQLSLRLTFRESPERAGRVDPRQTTAGWVRTNQLVDRYHPALGAKRSRTRYQTDCGSSIGPILKPITSVALTGHRPGSCLFTSIRVLCPEGPGNHDPQPDGIWRQAAAHFWEGKASRRSCVFWYRVSTWFRRLWE